MAGTQQHGRPRPDTVDQQLQSDGGAPRRRDDDVRLGQRVFLYTNTPVQHVPRRGAPQKCARNRPRNAFSQNGFQSDVAMAGDVTSPTFAKHRALKAFGPASRPWT